MDFNLLLSALIGGGILLLALLKMTNALGVNQKANFYFGIFCLLWSSFWLDEFFEAAAFGRYLPLLALVKIAQFFVGSMFYVSVRYYADPSARFGKKNLAMLIAPAFFAALLFNRSRLEPFWYTIFELVLFLGHTLVCAILSYAVIRKHQKNIELFSSHTQDIDLRWIKYIIYAFMGTIAIVIVYNVFNVSQPLNIYVNIHMLAVAYFVAFNSIRQKEIFPKGLPIAQAVATVERKDSASKAKLMDETEMQIAKGMLVSRIETEGLYLDSELNLVKLAEAVSLSTHQLSYVINNGTGENFFNFVNRFRVQKAEKLLADPAFDSLTIVAIGFESGFNSKTAFNTAFKKITGVTPTEFRKIRPVAKPLRATF